MTVLDTFYILFKSDSKELKKGAEEALKTTEKLESDLKNIDRGANEAGKSFLNMASSAARMFAGFVTIGGIIAKATSSISYVNELQKLSRSLQVNISNLDAWGNAVERSGGSASAFQGSLKSLSEHFNITGDRALALLPRLADSLSRLSQTQALRYGKIFGLDEATILLLQHGRREVEAIIQKQKELGVVNAQDAEKVRKFNESLHDAGIAARSFFSDLISPALPYFTSLIKYFIEHKDLVIGAFLGIAAAAVIMNTPFTLTAAAVLALRAGIGLLITAFALVFDDISAFIKGNNSLTGELLKKWPIVKEVVVGAFEGIKAAIHALFHPLETLERFLNYISKKLHSIFGGSKELTVNINEGKKEIIVGNPNSDQLAIANFNPRAVGTGGKTNTVNVNGPITVNTQATDATGVAQGLGRGLNDQLAQVNNHVDDGVMY